MKPILCIDPGASGGLPCASTFVHLAITNDSSTNSLAIGYEVQVGGQQ